MNNRVIYENNFFQVILRNNEVLSLKNLKGGAVILPVTKEKQVILMKIFRKPINTYSLEAPRGFKEVDEDSIETAKREMNEEISCVSNKIIFLGSMYPDSGLMDSKVDIYLGVDCVLKKDKLQSEEGIRKIELIDYKIAYEKAIEGEIMDSYTLVALLRSKKLFE